MYTSTCLICKEQGLKTIYIGESSNSLAERAVQHLNDAADPSKESHMAGHIKEQHPGAIPEETFQIKQLSSHLSAFSRQLEEAYHIKTFKGGTLLNHKFEYNHNLLPTVTTDNPRHANPNPSQNCPHQQEPIINKWSPTENF